jgi:hypothetical protein
MSLKRKKKKKKKSSILFNPSRHGPITQIQRQIRWQKRPTWVGRLIPPPVLETTR